MKKIFAYFKLIRWKNILMLALLQGILSVVLHGFFSHFIYFELNFSFFTSSFFLAFFFAPLLIAAGGYIINDIEDQAIDEQNKPDQVIVGKVISKKTAFFAYFLSTLLGLWLGMYVVIWSSNVFFLVLYPSTIVLLWLYAKFFKKQLWIGNLTVALLCALVPLSFIAFCEGIIPSGLISFEEGYYIYKWYAIFAFLTTLIREIIKDLEDMNGDALFGCRTLPIIYGIKKTKKIVNCLLICLASFVIFVFWGMGFKGVFFEIILLSLLFYIYTQLHAANNPFDYHQVSTICKVFMLLGLVFLGCLIYL